MHDHQDARIRPFASKRGPLARVGTAMSALAVASACLAQEDRVVELSGSSVPHGSFGGYSDRAYRVVYHIGTPAQTGGDFRSSGTCVYDDVTFPSWAKIRGEITIAGVAFAPIVPATASWNEHLYLRLLFYPVHDSSVATSVQPYSGTPVVWDLDMGSAQIYIENPGAIQEPYPLDTTVTLNERNVFQGGPADFTCGVYQELFLDAAFTRYADGWQIVRRGLWSAPRVGSTDYWGWFSAVTGTTPGSILNGNRSGGTLATARASFLGLLATGYASSAGCHGACPADIDDGVGQGTPDGGVTTDDLLYYLLIFANGWECADTDDGSGTGTPDNGVTIDDLLYYLARFEAGC